MIRFARAKGNSPVFVQKNAALALGGAVSFGLRSGKIE
jgi:hypothetical protein